MKKFSNYDNVKTNNFEKEKLTVGGHICRILEVKEETVTPKNGNPPFNQLIIKFDLDDKDKQAGFFKRRYAEDADVSALEAKWKGIYKLNVPKDDGSEADEKSKVTFKTFITCIEKSNPNYTWEWDEKTLKGKVFGGVFGVEEFTNLTGETVWSIKCKFVRSTEKIEETKIPKVKDIDGNLVDYEEWLAKKKENYNNNKNNSSNSNTTTNIIDESDDLPF